MKNLQDYISLAINRHGLRGNNALAKELNITSAGMSNLNTGKILPADSTMIKLAELAGLPKEEALIDLNLWRSEKQPEIKKVWQRVAGMIKMLCFSLLICPEKVNAADFKFKLDDGETLYFITLCALFMLLISCIQIKHYATILILCVLALFFAVFAISLIKKRGLKWTNLKN